MLTVANMELANATATNSRRVTHHFIWYRRLVNVERWRLSSNGSNSEPGNQCGK